MLKFNDPIKLDRLPLDESDFISVSHLMEYDGPLLSAYYQEDGDCYLKYWCDCDSISNRWMWIRVAKADLVRVQYQFEPMSFLIPHGALDSFVYFVNEDDNGVPIETVMVRKDSIPTSYTPKPHAMLKGAESAFEENTFSLPIQGNWSVEDLTVIPRELSRTYSIAYAANAVDSVRPPQLPFRGDGYSGMHWVDWVEKFIPSSDRATVKSMQYASPGYIKLSVNDKAIGKVMICIDSMKRNNTVVAGLFSSINSTIRNHNLNKDVRETLKKHSDLVHQISNQSLELIDNLNLCSKSDFSKLCGSEWVTIKMAMSFYRRIKKLLDYEKRGLVRYPKVSM